MSKVIFILNGAKATIQCNGEDKLVDIVKKFKIKSQININKTIFLYEGKIINLELKFNEIANQIDKEKNEMSILAIIFDDESQGKGLVKSKDIICPICNENCLISLENFRIKLYNCKNEHITSNIPLGLFDKSQNINENEIKCLNGDQTKFNSFRKQFYRCLECKVNLCPICNDSHNKEHRIIDYKDINYICLSHKDFYVSYCNECKKNLCLKCEVKHDANHQIINYKDILPDEDEIKEELKLFRIKIDKSKEKIIEIINILKKVSDNIEEYYKIIHDILYNYNIQQRNYEILTNVNSIENFLNQSDINDIIKENDNYCYIFEKIIDLYSEMYPDKKICKTKLKIKKKTIIKKSKHNNPPQENETQEIQQNNSSPIKEPTSNNPDREEKIINETSKEEKAPAIGIDFGTSKCCIGVFRNGKVEIIPSDMGENIIPSIVSFTDTERLVGSSCLSQINKNVNNTVFNIMRLIGHNFEDKNIQEELKYWPFEVLKDPNSDKPLIQVNYKNEKKTFTVEEILAMELKKIKEIASNYLGQEVKDAVISIPSCYNFLQIQIVKDAATISGLNVIRVVHGTLLASNKYYFDNKSKISEESVLIFDLGAGFLSVSLILLDDGLFEVQAVNGNNYLGGVDFDNRLIDYCIDQFKKKTSIDITKNPKALRRLRTECEKSKKILSTVQKTVIEIESLMDGEDLIVEITREKFEELCSDLFQKIFPLLKIY